MRSLLSLIAATSLLLAQAPVQAEGEAEDLGVMNVSLKDSIKPRFGLQGETQGAGTPNQAGVGGFLPLKINDNSVWFVDALANVNFADFNAANSSLGGTVLDAFTISTSTRLGYRWLNGDRSWMFGINAGYDSRPVKSGDTMSGYKVYDQQTPFFQQVAVSAEAIHKKWDLNAYALIPIGEYGLGSGNVANLNSLAGASPLTTIGLKVAYAISDKWKLGAGYYYEVDEKSAPDYPDYVDGSGVQASLSYDINNQLEAGVLYSYDDYFKSRVSGNLTWRFNGRKAAAETRKSAVMQGLTAKPKNRTVRVANSMADITIKCGRRAELWLQRNQVFLTGRHDQNMRILNSSDAVLNEPPARRLQIFNEERNLQLQEERDLRSEWLRRIHLCRVRSVLPDSQTDPLFSIPPWYPPGSFMRTITLHRRFG